MTIDPANKIRLIMHLRNMGIRDTDTLSAMEKVPREIFIPLPLHDKAYEDTALPIGLGQTISQPFIVAFMTEALELDKSCKVLEIGTGSGYQTSILANMCRRVYTIERHKPLLERAEEVFRKLRLGNITAIAADGMKGWPEKSQLPFDRIICTAAAAMKPPAAFFDQLKDGGILVMPVGTIEGGQKLMRYKKEQGDVFSVKELLTVRFVPLLPDVPDPSTYLLKELGELA
ncbi:MAG: protein-L-isoaspartate(D-aspartate) O-methyltransferase [Alphaproteobacteria bacterium]|nr:protein-L-isoaspartate(D-aspartate) O-methyltransferase [Alphaproteobacteria bacterium]